MWPTCRKCALRSTQLGLTIVLGLCSTGYSTRAILGGALSLCLGNPGANKAPGGAVPLAARIRGGPERSRSVRPDTRRLRLRQNGALFGAQDREVRKDPPSGTPDLLRARHDGKDPQIDTCESSSVGRRASDSRTRELLMRPECIAVRSSMHQSRNAYGSAQTPK
eukprot:1188103-Prorocentrum_minimum.AAC.3